MKKMLRNSQDQAEFISSNGIVGRPSRFWIKQGGTLIAHGNVPAGWDLTQSGTVTVPSGASLGNYTAEFFYIPGVTHNSLVTSENGTRYLYEFTVVCTKAVIYIEESDRNETHYELTCRADVQGGTPGYTYAWTCPTGFTILSGQTAQTCVVKVPVGAAGAISVSTLDSTFPKCSAGASFNVCDYTCDFTPVLAQSPIPPATGPYIFQCEARTAGGTAGNQTYAWSPASNPTYARSVQIAVPDDGQHSIYLAAMDSAGCQAFKTRKVGGHEFTISVTPDGFTAGNPGTTLRDDMKFEVIVVAEVTPLFTGTPPATVIIEFHRPKDNSRIIYTATKQIGITPARYLLPADVDVTTLSGRYYVSVQGYRSNSAMLKIDKREQLSLLGLSWVGHETPPATNCHATIDYIYTHLGLPLGSGGSPTGLWLATTSNPGKDTSKGSVVFYRSPGELASTWTDTNTTANGAIVSHSALRVDGGIIDTNCGTPGVAPPMEIHYHIGVNDPLGANPNRSPINVALDTKNRTPPALAELDDE